MEYLREVITWQNIMIIVLLFIVLRLGDLLKQLEQLNRRVEGMETVIGRAAEHVVDHLRR